MSHIEILIKQITTKNVRPYKGGTELRVHNLDDSKNHIQRIITSQNLNLTITEVDPILCAVIVHPA